MLYAQFLLLFLALFERDVELNNFNELPRYKKTKLENKRIESNDDEFALSPSTPLHCITQKIKNPTHFLSSSLPSLSLTLPK